MGVPIKHSFIHSIHNIMEPEFLLRGPIQKEKTLDEFRNNVVLEIDELFKNINMGKRNLRKVI